MLKSPSKSSLALSLYLSLPRFIYTSPSTTIHTSSSSCYLTYHHKNGASLGSALDGSGLVVGHPVPGQSLWSRTYNICTTQPVDVDEALPLSIRSYKVKAPENRHTMASYVSFLDVSLSISLSLGLHYIYVTHVYFWENFNRLFRYWLARWWWTMIRRMMVSWGTLASPPTADQFSLIVCLSVQIFCASYIFRMLRICLKIPRKPSTAAAEGVGNWDCECEGGTSKSSGG